MTDTEIIKACKNCLHYEACKGTYSSAKGDEDILHDFDGEMYANSGCEDFEDKDHINRQQAENERLQKLLDNKCDRCIANERAEAVRECIEKIKSKAAKCVMTDNGIPVAGSASYSISEVELYKIEKEMVGAESGSIL